MKIGVIYRLIPDTEKHFDISSDGEVDSANLSMLVNPTDENALESALSYKDKFDNTQIVLIGVGPHGFESEIRSGVSLGVESAIYFNVKDYFSVENSEIALKLSSFVTSESIDMIFIGNHSLDTSGNSLSAMLAAYLKWDLETNINKLEYQEGGILVSQNISANKYYSFEVGFPVVLAVNKDVNEVRYPNIIEILNGKKKLIRIEEINSDDNEVLAIKKIKTKNQNVFFEGDIKNAVQELIGVLKEQNVI